MAVTLHGIRIISDLNNTVQYTVINAFNLKTLMEEFCLSLPLVEKIITVQHEFVAARL